MHAGYRWLWKERWSREIGHSSCSARSCLQNKMQDDKWTRIAWAGWSETAARTCQYLGNFCAHLGYVRFARLGASWRRNDKIQNPCVVSSLQGPIMLIFYHSLAYVATRGKPLLHWNLSKREVLAKKQTIPREDYAFGASHKWVFSVRCQKSSNIIWAIRQCISARSWLKVFTHASRIWWMLSGRCTPCHCCRQWYDSSDIKLWFFTTWPVLLRLEVREEVASAGYELRDLQSVNYFNGVIIMKPCVYTRPPQMVYPDPFLKVLTLA